MPDNLDEPSHRLMRDVAAGSPCAGKLETAGKTRTAVASADWYHALLKVASVATYLNAPRGIRRSRS